MTPCVPALFTPGAGARLPLELRWTIQPGGKALLAFFLHCHMEIKIQCVCAKAEYRGNTQEGVMEWKREVGGRQGRRGVDWGRPSEHREQSDLFRQL